MTEKNILVVGGAGYIGSHVTLALRDNGYLPVVYDNFSTGHTDACFGTAVVDGHLSEVEKLVRVMRDHRIDGVIHLAALIEAGASVLDPLAFYRNNVCGTVCLLEAMQIVGVSRLVFSSTAAVYGDGADGTVLSERNTRDPVNPYGHSKAMVETILASAASAYGLQSIALRYFNAAGADKLARTGERHDPETHLIPLVIQAALGLRPDIKIFGADYDTPDGTCIRDYIHVSDLAAGHIAAYEHLCRQKGGTSQSFNLGTGVGHSVRQVIDQVAKISGRDFAVQEMERRAGDPQFLVADPSLAKSTLGWSPEFSDLNTIISDAWRYARKQQDLRSAKD